GTNGSRRCPAKLSGIFAEPDGDVGVENDHSRFPLALEGFAFLLSYSLRSAVPGGKMSSSHSRGSTMGETISPATRTFPWRNPKMLAGFSSALGTIFPNGLPRFVTAT